jgi:hypothetical protein
MWLHAFLTLALDESERPLYPLPHPAVPIEQEVLGAPHPAWMPYRTAKSPVAQPVA